MVQPKLRNLEMLTNECDKNGTKSDMIEELIQIETDGVVLNESTSQPVTSKEINEMIESNWNKILNQTVLKLNQVQVT